LLQPIATSIPDGDVRNRNANTRNMTEEITSNKNWFFSLIDKQSVSKFAKDVRF